MCTTKRLLRKVGTAIILYAIIIAALIQTNPSIAQSQKPVIDTSVINNWQTVDDGILSPDGQYIAYAYNQRNKSDLIISTNKGRTLHDIVGVSTFSFSPDSRSLAFLNAQNRLGLINLKTGSVHYYENVSNYFFFTGRSNYLVCYLRDRREAIFVNFNGKLEKTLVNVDAYWTDQTKRNLFVQHSDQTTKIFTLSKIENIVPTEKIIWKGKVAVDQMLIGGDAICFSLKNDKSDFCFLREGMNRPSTVSLEEAKKNGLVYDRFHFRQFTYDENKVFVEFEHDLPKLSENLPSQLEIWSYMDSVIYPLQQTVNKNSTNEKFAAVIDLQTSHVVQITDNHQQFQYHPTESSQNWVIIKPSFPLLDESNWNKHAISMCYLFNFQTNEKQLLKDINYDTYFSPGGNFITGINAKSYDPHGIIYVYSIKLRKLIDITAAIHPRKPPLADQGTMWGNCYTIVGWSANEKQVLVSDQQDIWSVDLNKTLKTVCVTSIPENPSVFAYKLVGAGNSRVVNPNTPLILSTYNIKDKARGFAKISINQPGRPITLSAGEYESDIVQNCSTETCDLSKQGYLLLRSNENHSPNYYFTADFRTFLTISNCRPETRVKWYYTKLFTWKDQYNLTRQAIGYFPENFDSTRKYPVIFKYYENVTDQLHKFIPPCLMRAEIEIPWFVSRDYIIIRPDIENVVGAPGIQAFDVLDACAKHFAHFNWADSKHFGLNGVSFGGFETNNIITRTNAFCSALSVMGPVDLISWYNSITEPGSTSSFWTERGQLGLGGTLWGKLSDYIKNSPIFLIDHVTTPLLISHNKHDNAAAFTQGIELFTSLRRLGKKAWLLQYDDGTHGLDNIHGSAFDYTRRVEQFFDFYLKNKPAPRWMVESIPAAKKGIDDGFDLMPPGVEPGPGLNSPEDQQKIDEYSKKSLSEKLKPLIEGNN